MAIREDVLYRVEEYKEEMGIKKAAWRTLLRDGFPVIRQGRRAYVDGRAAIAHMRSRSGEQQQ